MSAISLKGHTGGTQDAQKTPLRVARFQVEVSILNEAKGGEILAPFERASKLRIQYEHSNSRFFAYFESAREAHATALEAVCALGGCKTQLEEGSYYCLVEETL